MLVLRQFLLKISFWARRYTCVGQDCYGNTYYETPLKKRLVLYTNAPEASKISPEWHSWIHYVSDHIPDTGDTTYSWQKKHLPNLTGTIFAHQPPGFRTTRNISPIALTQPYAAWHPDKTFKTHKTSLENPKQQAPR